MYDMVETLAHRSECLTGQLIFCAGGDVRRGKCLADRVIFPPSPRLLLDRYSILFSRGIVVTS